MCFHTAKLPSLVENCQSLRKQISSRSWRGCRVEILYAPRTYIELKGSESRNENISYRLQDTHSDYRPLFLDDITLQSEPYVDWVFDFEQAQKADDAEAVSKLITSQPALARVWFYGFVYDVVNKGVPVGEQAAIRSRCDLIARTLANVG